MSKRLKGKLKSMRESVTTSTFTTAMPTTLSRLMSPFYQDDHTTGTGFASPASRFSVHRSFIDGLSSELVTIANRGRKLQINPATKEAWVAQGGRNVYLGTLDTWNDVHIRKLILRYLGTMSDAMVNSTLRQLGLIEDESTMTTNIATPSIGMAPIHMPFTDPLTPKGARRKKR